MDVETSQFSMCLCVPFTQRSLHFFSKSFLFLFLFLCYPYFGTFLSTWFLSCYYTFFSFFCVHLSFCSFLFLISDFLLLICVTLAHIIVYKGGVNAHTAMNIQVGSLLLRNRSRQSMSSDFACKPGMCILVNINICESDRHTNMSWQKQYSLPLILLMKASVFVHFQDSLCSPI